MAGAKVHDERRTTDRDNGGLAALRVLAGLHGVDEVTDVLEPLACERVDAATLVRAARALGLRARALRRTSARLRDLPLPALASTHDGRWVVVAALRARQVLLLAPGGGRPRSVPLSEFELAWDGGLIVVAATGTSRAAPGRFGLAWFKPWLWTQRAALGEVLLVGAVLQLLALVTPLFFQVVIDKVLVHRGLTTLDVLAVGMLAVMGFEALLGLLRARLLTHAAGALDEGLGDALGAHLLRLPLAWFEARRVGDVVARIRELETLREFLTGHGIGLALDAVFALGFLLLMLLYSPLLTGVVLAILPGYVVLALGATPALRARLEQLFERGAEHQACVLETVTGIVTVKALAAEPAFYRRWQQGLRAQVRAALRARRLAADAQEAAALLNKLMLLGVLWLGARAVIAGDLSVGQLVAFNMLAARISAPFARLMGLWQDVQQARVSLRRVADILATPAEPAPTAVADTACDRVGAIAFERVRFRYHPEGPVVLDELSLSVAPGENVGIVGACGSGKSTLFRLLLGLYRTEQGTIRIGGREVGSYARRTLRRHFGVLMQDSALFEGSVRENIALAAPASPFAQIVAAARAAGAHAFIETLPQGYDTRLGERGVGLSGGQRQLLALARALLGDPPVLLLDEATSALDPDAEAAFQRALARCASGRTVLMVAHRLSALRGVDRIVVIERGRVVEQGPPDALRASGGHFTALYAS